MMVLEFLIPFKERWAGGVYFSIRAKVVKMQKLTAYVMGLVANSADLNVALAQVSPPPTPDGPWHMMHDWSTWPGGMWLGPIWMIVWLAVSVAIVVGLVRWLGGSDARRQAPTARDILDERYARGEIDRDEYLKRKRDIAGGS